MTAVLGLHLRVRQEAGHVLSLQERQACHEIVALCLKDPEERSRPADVIGNAVKVMRIATSEESDDIDSVKSAAAELGTRGGKARAATMTPERRAEIARKAAAKRWNK
jgi:hypothetical protein